MAKKELLTPAAAKPSASSPSPLTRTCFVPHWSDSLPAAALEMVATIKVGEKRLPAATLERDNDSRRSGNAMPRAAIVIEGNRLEAAAISAVDQSVAVLFGARRWPVACDDECCTWIRKGRQKHGRVPYVRVAADAMVPRCHYLYSAKRSGSNIAENALLPG